MRNTFVTTHALRTVIVKNPHMCQTWLETDSDATDLFHRMRTFHHYRRISPYKHTSQHGPIYRFRHISSFRCIHLFRQNISPYKHTCCPTWVDLGQTRQSLYATICATPEVATRMNQLPTSTTKKKCKTHNLFPKWTHHCIPHNPLSPYTTLLGTHTTQTLPASISIP